MSAKLAVRSEPYLPIIFSSVTVRSGKSTPESVLVLTKNIGVVKNLDSMTRESWTRLICSLGLETMHVRMNQQYEMEHSHSVDSAAS